MNDLLFNQIKTIIKKDIPLTSNLANISALLFKMENINWAGFYLMDNDRLVLGPFQGDVACTIIPLGKGICGTAAAKKETIIVEDVNKFEGHIACSSLSKSEIVVPIIINNKVFGVIDIDAPIYSRFSTKEKAFLEKVAKEIEHLL